MPPDGAIANSERSEEMKMAVLERNRCLMFARALHHLKFTCFCSVCKGQWRELESGNLSITGPSLASRRSLSADHSVRVRQFNTAYPESTDHLVQATVLCDSHRR